jgi:hypothetical protein
MEHAAVPFWHMLNFTLTINRENPRNAIWQKTGMGFAAWLTSGMP